MTYGAPFERKSATQSRDKKSGPLVLFPSRPYSNVNAGLRLFIFLHFFASHNSARAQGNTVANESEHLH